MPISCKSKPSSGVIKTFCACRLLVVAFCLALLSACTVRHVRGSYFIYGMQWGMTWQEVDEVLKPRELKEAKSGRFEKVAKAPFFIAGVPGELTLTFKKPLFGKPVLKGIKYEAEIGGADIRREAYLVLQDDLRSFFGEPSKQTGTVEPRPSYGSEESTDNNKVSEPYSAIWLNEDGNVIVEVNPRANKFVLHAEANTANPKLAWLK